MCPERSLSSLVGSRICHDLVSPLGAIGNGLELIMLSGSANGPELLLMSESVASAAARLRIFRIAFGLADGDQRLAAAECQSVLDGYFAKSRLSATWRGPASGPRGEVQLAMLLVLCAESALPRGGQIRVDHDGRDWLLTATGQGLAADDDLWSILTDRRPAPGDLPAGKVHFALAADAAAASGRRIRTTVSGTKLEVSF